MKNTTFARLTVLVLTIALGSFACASTKDSAPSQGEMAQKTEKAAEKSQPMDSGEILQVMRTINEGEISQAQIALQNSDNPDVQETAEVIIRDHRMMNQRIDALSQEIGADLQETALSRGLEMQTSQIQNQLSELSGAEFDREFLRRQIQLHELSLDTARQELMPSASNAQVRQLLSEASDHLEQHLTVAQRNYEELQDTATGGGPTDDMAPDDMGPEPQSPDEMEPTDPGPDEMGPTGPIPHE